MIHVLSVNHCYYYYKLVVLQYKQIFNALLLIFSFYYRFMGLQYAVRHATRPWTTALKTMNSWATIGGAMKSGSG